MGYFGGKCCTQAVDLVYMCTSTGIHANIVTICVNPQADLPFSQVVVGLYGRVYIRRSSLKLIAHQATVSSYCEIHYM